jgi:hypothetical protein
VIFFFILRVKKPLKAGKTRTLHGVDPEFSSVLVTCIGKKGEGYDELETVDKGRESIRAAVASKAHCFM